MEPVKLFQYNTLGALMAGLYGGSFTIKELGPWTRLMAN